MFLAFAFSVVVQFNDPDPVTWAAVYGAAAYISLLEIWRRNSAWFPGLVSFLTLAWAAMLAPRVIGKVRFMDMFAEFEMKDIGIEESREMYGLLLVAIWMAVVAIAAWRRRTDSSP
jgi:hypothetical protein